MNIFQTYTQVSLHFENLIDKVTKVCALMTITSIIGGINSFQMTLQDQLSKKYPQVLFDRRMEAILSRDKSPRLLNGYFVTSPNLRLKELGLE